MCFGLAELYLENSLFLLKACFSNDGINAQNQQGSWWFSHRPCTETYSRIYLHACIFTCASALRCLNGGVHGVHGLLLPRVYLQTVTLMQCNDYFYSRYFGSPFALSGMTPHRPTDYLCSCCHTWLLRLASVSTITLSELSHFYYSTIIWSSLLHSLPVFIFLHHRHLLTSFFDQLLRLLYLR